MPKPLTFPLPAHWGMGVNPDNVKHACAMGIDVRPGSWDVAIGDVIRPQPGHPVVRLLFYGKVRDDDDVEFLASRYPVRALVGDCRPETHTIRKLMDRLRMQKKTAWIAQYNSNSNGTTTMIENKKEHLLTLDRCAVLDEVFFAANSGLGLAIPENFRDICNGLFAKEICVPTRVPAMKGSEEYHVWTDHDKADHSFHALAYLFVALKISKLWDGGGSEAIMAMPGAVVGTLSETSDPTNGDSDYVDMADMSDGPAIAEDGRMTWTDFSCGGTDW